MRRPLVLADTKEVKTIPHTEMDLDYFLAVDAVPGVVPPVAKDGTLYIDAMLLKDANLTEAVRQQADETCAIGNLKRELAQIEEINRKVAGGTAEPGQREIKLHIVQPDQPVPVDYLFFKSKKQMRPVIETGRAYMRRYLGEQGYL